VPTEIWSWNEEGGRRKEERRKETTLKKSRPLPGRSAKKVPRTQRPQNQPQARDEKQENRKIIFQKYAYIHDCPDYHLQGGPLF
jgi:hypothetical protein